MSIHRWAAGMMTYGMAVAIGGEVAAEPPAKVAEIQEAAPEGFRWQVMEPTGGRILVPRGWFFKEGHHRDAWMWTISKEDPADGYETGMRIQAFLGIGAKTGGTAEKFAGSILAKHKDAAEVVNKTCEPEDHGLFTRQCLGTTEGKFRIMYSFFWNNEIDLAVITISGTTKENWKEQAKTFDVMSAFELIDMSRFEEDDPDSETK